MSGSAVVITGAGRGIGAHLAHYLAEAGHFVAVLDLDGSNAGQVASEIAQAGGSVASFAVDVTDEDALAGVAEVLKRDHGGVMGLVNNAALFQEFPYTEIDGIALRDWNRVLDVNITGTFLASRVFARHMREAGYGKIVNVSSGTVFMGRAGYLHYVTSKAAVIGMTRGLATELGPNGIRVNAIAPGMIDTGIDRPGVTEDSRNAYAERTALHKRLEPSDLVGTIRFLLSPGSDYLTGQTIVVDGGFNYN